MRHVAPDVRGAFGSGRAGVESAQHPIGGGRMEFWLMAGLIAALEMIRAAGTGLEDAP